jgi:hypothetical protein
MTRGDLLEVVYRFYPRGLWTTSPGYDETPERLRQVDAMRSAAAEYSKWQGMLDRLGARYGFNDLSLPLLGGSFDSAYSAKLGLPGKAEEEEALQREIGFHVGFGCHVSILGPYYVVRRTGSPDEEPHAREVAREIEATYRYEPVPPELGGVVVPDVALDTVHMGEATVYDCLLSGQWGPCRSNASLSRAWATRGPAAPGGGPGRTGVG